jgi:hypothetical protein
MVVDGWQAFDLAYMLDGKYSLKKDPTLTGRHTAYLKSACAV